MNSTKNSQFRILAPFSSAVPPQFGQSKIDAELHSKLTFDAQVLRGLALKEECGLTATELLPDGRHFQEADAESWHVLLQDAEGCILGCARYRPLRENFDELTANHSALAHSRRYGPQFRSIMNQLFAHARKHNKECGEAGGWVLQRELRGSTAALNIALMTFALAEYLNCGLGITTATRMHHSAAMLCRIGACRVAGLPAYYEPLYGSIIELLQFDLPYRNLLYATRLDKFREMIVRTPVIAATKEAAFHPSEVLNLASALSAYDHSVAPLIDANAEVFRSS